jgi:hypothetical protein
LAEFLRHVRRVATLGVPPWLAAACSGVVVVVALLRGFSREVHPYALSQYQYTYEHGFLIRGLPGELARHACGRSFDCLARFVDVVGTCSVIAFALVLWLGVQLRTRMAPAANLTLAALGSGPLLVEIGATRGYHDALTLALGLGAYFAFAKRRFVACVLLFGLGLLVHELVAVYALPLFALPLLASWKERALVLRQVTVVLVLAGTAVAVVKLGHANHAQQRQIASRLAESESLGRRWRQYRSAGIAAARTPPGTLNPARLGQLGRPVIGRYLAPLVGALLLVLILLVARRQALWFPLYATVLVAPLSVLLVAWDVERLLSLAGVTALFVCLAVEERCEIRRAPLYALVGTLLVAALGLRTHYNVAGRYAYNGTLLGPERHRR